MIPERCQPPSSSASLRSALRRHLGYFEFRAGQEALIRAVLTGRDALGILPTGGGKSVCFQLPAFLLRGLVLVVSPLVSLMEDQVGRGRAAGLRAEALNASLSTGQRRRILSQAESGLVQLLFVSPERLHLPGFLTAVHRLPVALLAVDEAHCISAWGHDFRPAYLRIGEVRRRIRAPALALTATATPRVREEIQTRLRLRDPLRVVGSFDRPNLHWAVEKAESHQVKVTRLRSLLRRREGAVVVYSATRKSVEAIRRALASRGLPATAYHAGLPPPLRTRVQEHFLGNPAPVVVATNAFGMGIDRSDVRMVLHYQLPDSLEAYYQEAGRAGRDGREALCLALFGERDRQVHERFLAESYPPEEHLQRLHRHLLRSFPIREEVRTTWSALARTWRGFAGAEELRAAALALSRCGAIVVEEPADGMAQGVTIMVRTSSPSLTSLARLRSIREGQIDAVQRYARGRECRRKAILSYFGDRAGSGKCGRCDRCSGRWWGPRAFWPG